MSDALSPEVMKLAREMREGLEGVTPGPYAYRPLEYDDWGFVRAPTEPSGITPLVMRANLPYQTEEELNDHRRAGTDPWERDARHFARCSPDNIRSLLDAVDALTAERASCQARVEELERALDSAPEGSGMWRFWSAKAAALSNEIATLRALADRKEGDA